MEILLAAAFFIIALLYASVGNGGGSGYLAVMGLVGFPPMYMKPVALSLNIVVASIGAWKYIRAGHFSRRLFWPIALASAPAAFLGGRIILPDYIYRTAVALILFYAAFRLWRSARRSEGAPPALPAKRDLPVWGGLLIGAGIGLLSGVVGIGGGIFLGPLLLLAGWADTRGALGVTAAFVLTNSAAGLTGYLSQIPSLPPSVLPWLAAVAFGGWFGAEYGSKRLDPIVLRRILAVVLLLGGIRLLLLG